MQLVVGQIGRPHGIRGEVTVLVRTDDPELRFKQGSELATEPSSRGPLTVAASHWHSGRLLVSFVGYVDRNEAEELRGTLLVVDSAEVGPAGPEEFRDYDLIGLNVLTRSGEPVGVVTDVLHHGQDLLVVAPSGPGMGGPGPDGPVGTASGRPTPGRSSARVGSEILVPFVSAIVPEVDLGAGRLVIDPPPGLLELGSEGE
jgi:16S rRNA processing protein RimM